MPITPISFLPSFFPFLALSFSHFVHSVSQTSTNPATSAQ